MKGNTKLLVFVVLVAGAVVVLTKLDLSRYFSLPYVQSQLPIFLEQVRQNSVESALIFFAIYFCVVSLSIPGAALLTMVAGAIFGFWRGFILVSFASTSGATIVFLVARFFLRDTIKNKFPKQVKKVDEGVKRDGALYLFSMRLTPIIPFFMVNLSMGLTAIPLWIYVVVSYGGMLAGTAVYVNVGQNITMLTSVSGAVSGTLILSLTMLALLPIVAKEFLLLMHTRRVYKHYRKRKPKVYDYAVAVIGGGSGGLVSAYLSATLRAKTVLFEKNKMGGECLHVGCVPSKALLSVAKLCANYHDAKSVGVHYGKPIVHFSQVMRSVRRAIKTIEPHDSIQRYEQLGVHCVQEEASIISPWEIRAGKKVYTAKKIIIASGSTPKMPDIPGLSEVRPYTSDTIWSLSTQPEHLLVLGGGPVGCELATAFASLRSKVTVIDLATHILHREDTDTAAVAQKNMENRGIKIYTNAQVLEIKVKKGSKYRVTFVVGKKREYLECDAILVSTGRHPSTEGLGLDRLCVSRNEDGTIMVDKYLRTTYPNIFAVGDVASSLHFTHVAAYMAERAVVNALFGKVKKMPSSHKELARVTFLSPEVAQVGLNEKEAKQQNLHYDCTVYEMREEDRAIMERKTEGFIKVLTTPRRDTIVGATIVGERAGELIATFDVAMKNNIGLKKLAKTTFAYPTFSGALRKVALQWKKDRIPEGVLALLEKILRRRCKK